MTPELTISDILGSQSLNPHIFSRSQIKKLEDLIFMENGKARIKCQATDRTKIVKKEEIVRQLFIMKLMEEYHYPKERITVEKPVQFGSAVHNKPADIVVFHEDVFLEDKKESRPYIIVEVKKPGRKDGVNQLKSYSNAEGSPIACWCNGNDIEIMYREEPNRFVHIPDLPENGQSLNDVLDKPWTIDLLTKKNRLAKGLSLKELINNLEDLVLANSGVDSFEEVFKLIYAKLYDEYRAQNIASRKKKIKFRRFGRSDEALKEQINDLFEGAKKKWPGVFSNDDKIELTASHLATCVSAFEDIKLFNSNLSVIDEAFEHLSTAVAKGKKGQYFTPRHVIDMCVQILNPKRDEYVIDTAAGSCGFTMHAYFHVFNTDGMFSAIQPTYEQSTYAQEMIYGIDFDEKSVKMARALNLIAGDGKTNIYKANTLDTTDWSYEVKSGLKPRLKTINEYKSKKHNEKNYKYFDFDVLLTNPPFAGTIKESHILKNYTIAKNMKNHKTKIATSMDRHLLFIERNLEFLKEGGRMAIVLPQGVLSNTNLEHVRAHIMGEARILGVVSLGTNTFKPHTGTNTSVLFLQKWKNDDNMDDYRIFMAISDKSGKNNSGEYVYKRNKAGEIVVDSHGHPVIDHDLSEIASEFKKFLHEEGMEFA